MPEKSKLMRLAAAGWRDFAVWPRSARRTSIALVVLMGAFLPAACGTGDPSASDELTTTSTTVEQTTTTEPAPAPATTSPPTTSAPPPPTTSAPRPAAPAALSSSGVSFANCSEVKAAGAAPISRGEPGYSSKLDRDNDGIACES